MDRGAWWATVHEVARVGHDCATKLPPPPEVKLRETSGGKSRVSPVHHLSPTQDLAHRRPLRALVNGDEQHPWGTVSDRQWVGAGEKL